MTLLAAIPPASSKSSYLDPWEALHQRLPLYGQLTFSWLLNIEVPLSLTQASPMWPELYHHSSGIYVVVSPNTITDIPHILNIKNYTFVAVSIIYLQK
jgi:hypothetical protein